MLGSKRKAINILFCMYTTCPLGLVSSLQKLILYLLDYINCNNYKFICAWPTQKTAIKIK